MKWFSLFYIIFSLTLANCQEADTTVVKELDLTAVRYDKNFDLHYKQSLSQMKRTYPLAVRAKEILEELDEDRGNAKNRRSKNKLTKERKEELKDEFTFLLKDLYNSEGVMLFKLIHRETGLTVKEIMDKYNGKLSSNTATLIFRLYGHDTDIKYDPTGEDWVTELVIQDIIDGNIAFDMTIHTLTKEEFKESMSEYRSDLKQYRKSKRTHKKKKKPSS